MVFLEWKLLWFGALCLLSCRSLKEKSLCSPGTAGCNSKELRQVMIKPMPGSVDSLAHGCSRVLPTLRSSITARPQALPSTLQVVWTTLLHWESPNQMEEWDVGTSYSVGSLTTAAQLSKESFPVFSYGNTLTTSSSTPVKGLQIYCFCSWWAAGIWKAGRAARVPSAFPQGESSISDCISPASRKLTL